ncbi:hypothetical protein BKA81DRAFT_349647 [Phyllosticta paracitricarpa]
MCWLSGLNGLVWAAGVNVDVDLDLDDCTLAGQASKQWSVLSGLAHQTPTAAERNDGRTSWVGRTRVCRRSRKRLARRRALEKQPKTAKEARGDMGEVVVQGQPPMDGHRMVTSVWLLHHITCAGPFPVAYLGGLSLFLFPPSLSLACSSYLLFLACLLDCLLDCH